ncbi:uncharacterized protein LOC134104103 [Pungitius pungitius]|uniref:uncharacterized protein LOC134104103 n=1 Tax=Pungitius pungitius TaxID=134920 RepID=UPI002E165E22
MERAFFIRSKTNRDKTYSGDLCRGITQRVNQKGAVAQVGVTLCAHGQSLPSLEDNLVLVLGCSHLRAIADGFVTMPDGILTFGFLSIPGGSAADLKLEIENTVLTHQPDALCVLAPSNNLTASRSVSEAGADFAKLMTSVTKRFPNVFVLDFPPRLNCEVKDQDLLRQEFRDVTARMSVKYCSIAEYFPLQDRKLWVRDGVSTCCFDIAHGKVLHTVMYLMLNLHSCFVYSLVIIYYRCT